MTAEVVDQRAQKVTVEPLERREQKVMAEPLERREQKVMAEPLERRAQNPSVMVEHLGIKAERKVRRGTSREAVARKVRVRVKGLKD